MKRIAIIGGGISGLAAALTLERSRADGAPVDYVLYESHPRLGGVVLTEHVEGCVLEGGPDSFLTEKPWARDLCRELGLEDQLIPSNDAARKTYILKQGRLIKIPDGLLFLVPTKILPIVCSPLFSLPTKLRMAREWFHPPRRSNRDESVAAMVERHYGREMVDVLADPLLAGVYGGEASQLGVRAVLPRLVEMEAKYGSLGRAMLAARKKAAAAQPGPGRPLFTSLKRGMQQMVDAVISRLRPTSVCLRTQIEAVERKNGSWMISTESRSEPFEGVILAAPAHAAGGLLRKLSPPLAAELLAIPYTSSITINFVYAGAVRASLPPGFGFLVPSNEGRRILAATFVHNKFPYRAPEDRALIRCFLSGARNEGIFERSDEDILAIAGEELEQILRLRADPLFARVYRWKSTMAQYGVNHWERLQRIDALLGELPALALAGNGYRGIGVPDCVRTGQEAATRLLTGLGLAAASTPAPVASDAP
jgi:protoporphyrinogen/coproporphyrinogen III oxidase